MKEIILSPISIALILMVVLVFSLLVIQLISEKLLLVRLEKPTVVLVCIGMFPIVHPPFFFTHPQRLCTGNLSFTGILTTLLLWLPISFFIKRICFPNFPKDCALILRDPFLAVLILMSIISTLWSQTPDITLRSSFSFCVMAILAAHIAKKYSWKNIEFILRRSLTIVTFTSFLFTILLPSLHPFGDPWGGILPGARTFGAVAALNVGLWFAIAVYKGKFFGIESAISIASLLMIMIGAGKTQLIATLAIMYLIIILNLLRNIKFSQSVIAVIMVIVVTACLFILINTGFDALLQALGKDRSLTGRGEFWPQLIEEVMNHPLGFGYNGFWQPWRGSADPAAVIGNGTALGEYRPPHSHNGFLEVALQLGYGGLLIYLLSFIKTVSMAIWHQQFFKGTEGILPLIILTFLVMTNLSETEKLGLIGPNHVTFFYMLIAMKLGLTE